MTARPVNANHWAGADAFADGVAPAIRETQAAGTKLLREIAAALNGRGIAAARGPLPRPRDPLLDKDSRECGLRGFHLNADAVNGFA